MSTITHSRTVTIAGSDVRQVMELSNQEIDRICQAAAHAAKDFDADQCLIDCSLLCLNDVINSIRLQIYLQDEVVREYAYVVMDEAQESFGPPPDQPPLGFVPEGARIRLIVTRNPNQPSDYCQRWFDRLGWVTARPLQRPAQATHQTYGNFCSGGYSVERQVLHNPKYDRPLALAGSQYFGKER